MRASKTNIKKKLAIRSVLGAGCLLKPINYFVQLATIGGKIRVNKPGRLSHINSHPNDLEEMHSSHPFDEETSHLKLQTTQAYGL